MMAAKRRGWCPSALKPMATGDGLLMRLRPPRGRLSLAQVQGLAEAVLQHGNGLIDLTSRGNLQVRGLTPPAHLAMLDAAAAEGLLDLRGENGLLPELPCTILSSPLAAPSAILTLRAALEGALRAEPGLAGLPAKFCIVLDELAAPLFDDIPAHLRAYVATRGDVTLVSDGQDEVIGRAGALQALLGRALAAASAVTSPEGRPTQSFRATTGAKATLRPKITPGVLGLGAELGFAFGTNSGTMHASALLALVAALRRAGSTELRLTPWQLLIALPLTGSAVPGLITAAQACGFLVEGDDPRRTVSACPGQPACLQAHLPVRRDADLLAAQIGASLQQRLLHVHLSGCDKFCARPPHADFILEATADGYNVSGRAMADPSAHAKSLSLADAALRLA